MWKVYRKNEPLKSYGLCRGLFPPQTSSFDVFDVFVLIVTLIPVLTGTFVRPKDKTLYKFYCYLL